MPQIRVVIRGRNRPITKSFKAEASTVEGIIAEMNMNSQEVLVKLNREFVPDTERVRKGDRLELIEITSRG